MPGRRGWDAVAVVISNSPPCSHPVGSLSVRGSHLPLEPGRSGDQAEPQLRHGEDIGNSQQPTK